MQPLTLDDLLPLEEYAGRRAEFFTAQARYLDRYRRARVGPRLTLVFENRQTLWFRVHELLRVARLTDPARVRRELDWYNRLLPGRGRLQAALLLDVPDGPDWGREMAFWRDLSGEALRLVAGEAAAGARLVTDRPEDRSVGTALWVEFAADGELRRALADQRRPAFFAAEHQSYRHQSSPLSESMRQSLLDDLALSDHDRAA